MQGVYVTLAVTNLAILLNSCSQRPDMPDERERISGGVNNDSFIVHKRARTVEQLTARTGILELF